MAKASVAALEMTNAVLREANAALERQLRERTEQLELMVAEVSAAEERERRAIATDLHDDLVQLLNVIALRIETIAKAHGGATLHEHLDGLRELVRKCNDSTRSLALQLSPPVLDQLGLVPALAWLAEEMQRVHGLKVVMLDDGAPKPLGHVERAMVFRAVRELLINVAKHASVSQATLETIRRGDRMIITVSDTGVGFTPESALATASRSLGLSSVCATASRCSVVHSKSQAARAQVPRSH
jgi:signal transduction histidine kinase